MPLYDRRSDSSRPFAAYTDKNLEPCLDLYRPHLIEINKIVVNSKHPLEGNLFYFHEQEKIELENPNPARKHKRFNYAFFVLGGSRLLEIGFNAGHSAMLGLVSNPGLAYTGLDLGHHPYTVPCFQYLESVFGNRMSLRLGDSLRELPAIQDFHQFDLIHIDGGHGIQVAESDLCTVMERASKGTRILFDDVQVPLLRLLCDYYVMRGRITEIRTAYWKGEEQAVFRII